jgi:outer membrane protein TolC
MPALRVAVADSSAAAARLSSARIAQIPIPALVAGREWGDQPAGSERSVILGVAFPVPLWSAGRESVAEARGVAAEAAARAAEVRLALASQLASAQVRVAESTRRARFARDSLLAEATRIRAGTVRLYEAGRTGMLPVFDALRTERDVAREAVQELLAFQEARADLLALLGR